MRNRDDRPWREHHPHVPREFDQGGRRAHYRWRGAHENDDATYGHGPSWPGPEGGLGPRAPGSADLAGAPGRQGYPQEPGPPRRRRGAPQVVSRAQPGRPLRRGPSAGFDGTEGVAATSGYDDYEAEALYGSRLGEGDWQRTFHRGARGSRARATHADRDHRGKGPQGWRPSDERLLDEVHRRLTDDDYLDARSLRVAVDEGVVVLEGTVAQRWMKHHAEHVAARCYGIVDVDNRIRIRTQPQPM